MKRSEFRGRRAAFWCGCFVLLFVVRLCHIRVLWADEAYGMAAARRILEGATLYGEIWFDKPPLYAWIYLLWGAQAGWPLRLAGALFALLGCWLAAKTAARLFGEREGYFAAAGMAFFLSFDHPVAVLSLAPDFLLIPFMLAAVWALASGRPAGASAIAALGLVANTKALVLLPAILLWRPAAWKRSLPACLAAAGAVWLAARGWEEPVWQWGFLYARDILVANPVMEGLQRTLNWAGFHAALVVGSAFYFLRGDGLRWRMAVWLALSLAAVVAGARFFPRYYLVLLPVLAVAAARGFALLPRRRAAFVVAATLIVPAVRFGARHLGTWRETPAAMRDLALFKDCRDAAAVLRAMARPGDTLSVWGYRPELNVLAGLPGAAPFLDSQPLTGVLADRHLSTSQATASKWARQNRLRLSKTSPSFVADGLGPLNPALALSRYQDLEAWLAQYEVVGRTAHTVIYRRVRGSQSRGNPQTTDAASRLAGSGEASGPPAAFGGSWPAGTGHRSDGSTRPARKS